MGYVVLWIESLAVSLLFAAAGVALAARIDRRWLRTVVWILSALLPLAFFAGLTFLAGAVKFGANMATGWFVTCLALAFAYLVVAVALGKFGLSLSANEPLVLRAARWPLGKLIAGLLLVFALHLVSIGNVDKAIRQRITSLRTEAGALALSVAPARLADRENAALVYLQAFESMGDKDSWPQAWEDWTAWAEARPSGEAKLDIQNAELTQYLQRQTLTVELLLEAASMPGCYFEHDYGRPSINMLLTELTQLREAARLLALDARAQADLGELGESFGRINAIFAMAEHAGSEPILISMLVAAAIDRLALETMQNVIEGRTIPADALERLDLNSPLSYRRLLERSLRMEEAFGASVFCDVALGELSFAELESGAPPSSMTWLTPLYRLFLFPRDLAAYREYLHRSSELARQPYHERRSERDAFGDDSNAPRGGPLTEQLLPALGRASQAAAQADARRRLAGMADAALRYRNQHGRLPENWDELVPEFLRRTLTDPFDGQPLRMRRDDADVLLYSIGPDMVDDKGTSPSTKVTSDPEREPTDIVFRISA